MRQPSPASGKALFIILGLTATIGLLAILFITAERRAETSPVARGAHLAVNSGCFACHGRDDAEVRYNLRQGANGKWRDKKIPTMWEDGIEKADIVIDWITNGVPARAAERHKQLLIQMPAYKDRLTAGEIDDLAAWVLAEGLRLSQGRGNAARSINLDDVDPTKLAPDQLFILGDRLSRKHGCYQCHGELGQGGLANLASFKGAIPGFYGKEFLELTAQGDRAEILHWIDTGRGKAIESGVTGALATKFIDGQAIGMPAYKDHLNEKEKALLTEFLLLLNKTGPMPAKEVDRIGHLLGQK